MLKTLSAAHAQAIVAQTSLRVASFDIFDGRVAGHLGAADGLKTLSIHACVRLSTLWNVTSPPPLFFLLKVGAFSAFEARPTTDPTFQNGRTEPRETKHRSAVMHVHTLSSFHQSFGNCAMLSM